MFKFIPAAKGAASIGRQKTPPFNKALSVIANMEDLIEEIGIDEEERLYIKPATETFPMIYREAMEVHWNSEHKYLYGAKPRKWGYIEWYQQIIKAASEQGCKLIFSPSVSWVNIPNELQAQIVGEQSAKNT